MSRDPLPLALLGLALLNLGLGAWSLSRARAQHTTYVFTPLVDVIPGSSALSEDEALRVREDLRTQVDARDMQKAYAFLGSTLSLDDLAEGVSSLERSEHPLDAGQRARITEVLQAGRQRHEALWRTQDEILQLESQLAQEVSAVIEALPPEARAEAEAATQQLPGAEAPPRPGGAPPPRPGGPR
ncbi:MAG: hypothetical protein H6741_06245 [Alphaproteobacteria bacterium]|nr:hypothetical protein [Alphaproteobacteria bacterium]MCB9792310.1 hypothetical protein [Alphaproteobacteria bacterium]